MASDAFKQRNGFKNRVIEQQKKIKELEEEIRQLRGSINA
jgi:uncharacterized coiled-coil DUF342 family protein